MVADKHNFRVNFANAIAINDDRMALDLLLNELNELILGRPLDVLSALNTAGVEAGDRSSAIKIAKLTSQNMGKNHDLCHNLMALIIERENNDHVHSPAGQTDVVLNPEVTGQGEELCKSAGDLMARSLEDGKLPKKQVELLEEKMKQRGLMAGWTMFKKIAVSTAIIAGVATAAFGLFKLLSNTKEVPAPGPQL